MNWVFLRNVVVMIVVVVLFFFMLILVENIYIEKGNYVWLFLIDLFEKIEK